MKWVDGKPFSGTLRATDGEPGSAFLFGERIAWVPIQHLDCGAALFDAIVERNEQTGRVLSREEVSKLALELRGDRERND